MLRSTIGPISSKLCLSVCCIFWWISSNGQTLNNVLPPGAIQGQSLSVSISGQNTNFGQSTNTMLWFSQGSVTVILDSLYYLSPTYMTGDISFNYSHPVGYYDVNYYDPFDGFLFISPGFYLGPGSNPPSIVSVNPDSANTGQVLSVTISGQNTTFDQGSSTIPVWFIQGTETIYPDSVSINSSTELVAGFTIPQYASYGAYDVGLIDPTHGYVTKNNGFFIDTATVSIELYTKNREMAFRIFPNPCFERLNITYTLQKPADIEIILFDAEGKRVLDIVDERKASGVYQLSENLNALGLGGNLYFIRVSAGDITEVVKLFKL